MSSRKIEEYTAAEVAAHCKGMRLGAGGMEYFITGKADGSNIFVTTNMDILDVPHGSRYVWPTCLTNSYAPCESADLELIHEKLESVFNPPEIKLPMGDRLSLIRDE